ncbi:MAG TPA: hypothetical protein VF527_03375 [Pyrinomonadaceae bacterium]|jgi:hypothetical protein
MLFTIASAIFFLSLNDGHAQAQTDESRRFEVGGQFSVLNASNGRASVTRVLPCLVPPCPTATSTSEGHETEPGFGARIGYNLTKDFTLEAEGNFFPREREFGGGRKSQALFGVKAGKRFEQAGVFAKARPGFVRFSEGDLSRPRPGIACIAVFPPPAACFEATPKTHFAFDLGGVFEYYPSRRTLIRFDAGDTIIRFGEHRVPIVIDPGSGSGVRQVVVGTAPSETTHNFQGSIGIGVRF